jgi:hypothetical protein
MGSAVFPLELFFAPSQRRNQHLIATYPTLNYDPIWVVLKVDEGEKKKSGHDQWRKGKRVSTVLSLVQLGEP